MNTEDPEEHKRTPAILPVMIGMTILLLLTVIYCIYQWVKHSKEKRAKRMSHRSGRSGRGRHAALVEDQEGGSYEMSYR